MPESNTVKLIAALLLVDFLALNLYALYSVGASALIEMVVTSGPWMWATIADLLIALGLVSGFVWRDARTRGVNPMGYVIATFLTGSIAPLLYLIRRPTTP